MTAGRWRGSRAAASGGPGARSPAWCRRPAGSCGPAGGSEESEPSDLQSGTWTEAEDPPDSTETEEEEKRST